MSQTIRDRALSVLSDAEEQALEAAGVIDPDMYPDVLDKLIKAIRGRAWTDASEVVGDHAEEWYQHHMRQHEYPPPDYAQGVHAGLGLAQAVLEGRV